MDGKSAFGRPHNVLTHRELKFAHIATLIRRYSFEAYMFEDGVFAELGLRVVSFSIFEAEAWVDMLSSPAASRLVPSDLPV